MDNTFLIKNICKIGSSKRIYADEYTKTGIPFFRSTEVIELANKKQFKPKFYISKNKYNEISQKFPIPQNNDILIAAIGANMGTVYFVNLEYPFYFKDGNVIWLRDFDNIINSKFLYYWLITKKGYKELCNTAIGSAQKALTIDKIGNIKIKLPSIEFNNKILEKIDKLGVIKYKQLNDTLDEFCNFAIFKKGKEALSQNYTEENNNDNIHFIRVKDLNSLTNTYIPKNLNIPIANPCDILISFDGAIGRINYGLYGAYSSGIYKVIPCFKNNYGILYWALKDNYNQQVMLEHTNGTTILHGAKAIPYLKIKKHSSKDIDFYNNIFNYSLNIKLENIKLNILKQLYLKKFFR